MLSCFDLCVGGCPNLTCFRCGLFGHHSRNCFAPRREKSCMVCSRCGSLRHITLQCTGATIPAVDRKDSRVVPIDHHKHMRCMVCNKTGHAVCRAGINAVEVQQAGSVSDIYCYNCGRAGHHVDFPDMMDFSVDITATSSSSSKSKKDAATEAITGGDSGYCLVPRFEAYNKFSMCKCLNVLSLSVPMSTNFLCGFECSG